MKKNPLFEKDAPKPNSLSDAHRIIQELWTKLREYEDRLTQSSRNSSKSPSSDTHATKSERKITRYCGKNPVGAQLGHKGHRRPLIKLQSTDSVIICQPEDCCEACGGKVIPNVHPTRRHQVFELPTSPLMITEYQLFHGRCQSCNVVSNGKLPETAPQGQMGPRLMSYISVLAGAYHLSIKKTQRLLHDQFGITFSTGAISEAQGRISSMLTPIHQALKLHIQQATIIHADETPHQRNGEPKTRWCWLMTSSDAVFQNIRYFRDQYNAKHLLGKVTHAIVVTDQCPSYNWLDTTRHQFCLAHVQRNLQQMADYSGGGQTAHIGCLLVILLKLVFRTQHLYESGQLDEQIWLRRMLRLKHAINTMLKKGAEVPVCRYAGRCKHILKHEEGLWVFLNHPGTPLTNNEAERCIRGSVILRKICYGTSSERGDKFRSRVLSVIETCKKRNLSAIEVICTIVTAVITGQPYPDVFSFNCT